LLRLWLWPYLLPKRPPAPPPAPPPPPGRGLLLLDAKNPNLLCPPLLLLLLILLTRACPALLPPTEDEGAMPPPREPLELICPPTALLRLPEGLGQGLRVMATGEPPGVSLATAFEPPPSFLLLFPSSPLLLLLPLLLPRIPRRSAPLSLTRPSALPVFLLLAVLPLAFLASPNRCSEEETDEQGRPS